MNERRDDNNSDRDASTNRISINFDGLSAESVRQLADTALSGIPDPYQSSPIAEAFGQAVERLVDVNPEAATPIVEALAASSHPETRTLGAVVTPGLIRNRAERGYGVPPRLIEMWVNQIVADGEESVAASQSLMFLLEEAPIGRSYLGELALELADRAEAMATIMRYHGLDVPGPRS